MGYTLECGQQLEGGFITMSIEHKPSYEPFSNCIKSRDPGITLLLMSLD